MNSNKELHLLAHEYSFAPEFNQTVEIAYIVYKINPTLENFNAVMRAFAATVLESCITDGMQQEESTDLADQLFKGVK